MHRLHVPSATRKQALQRQIYEHRQPGPGGKASLPLVASQLRRKEARERKICLLPCWKTNLLLSICRRQHLLLCRFFLASLACLNEKWDHINQVLVTGDHVEWSHQTFGATEAMGSNHKESGVTCMSSLPLTLASGNGWGNLFFGWLAQN